MDRPRSGGTAFMITVSSVPVILALCLWSSGSAESGDEFSKDLAKLIHDVRPSEERQREALRVLSLLEDVLRTRWPGCSLVPFGSYVYGLALGLSDIDSSLMLPEAREAREAGEAGEAREAGEAGEASHAALVREVHRTLRPHAEFADFRPITWVLVPVINFNHVPTQFNIDISINAYREFQMSDLMKHLFFLDEKIFNLAFIVKYWAKLNNKAGAHLLANHGMLVLVIFYLQQRNMLPSVASLQKDADPYILYDWNYAFERLDYKVENDVPLNKLVGEFFEYYSTFDFKKYFISPYVGYPIERKHFEDLDTVPAEFVLYKEYVTNGVMAPLNLTKPVLLQDIFIHNFAIMSHQSPEPTSCFMTIFKYAASKYRDNKNGFLKHILSWEAAFFMKFDEDELPQSKTIT